MSANVNRLAACCAWNGMESDVSEFVQQCIRCADSRAGAFGRPLGETVHGTEVADMLHFDFLHLGVSDLLTVQYLMERANTCVCW